MDDLLTQLITFNTHRVDKRVKFYRMIEKWGEEITVSNNHKYFQ